MLHQCVLVDLFLSHAFHYSLIVPGSNFGFVIDFAADVVGKITMVSDVIPVYLMYQHTSSNTRTIMLMDLQ